MRRHREHADAPVRAPLPLATPPWMPNWCDNRLAISGPPAVVMELVRSVEGEEGVLDFETLLPTPPELLEAPAPPTGGRAGWYAWRREHWGVKWNASSATRRGYGRTGRVRYRFFTPYGPPTAFLDFVAGRFPDVAMHLTFDVELLGDGEYEWRDGRCTLAHERVPAWADRFVHMFSRCRSR